MGTLSTVNVKITGDTQQLVSSLTHAERGVTTFASKVTNLGTASTAQARGLSNLARGFTNAAGQSGVLNSEISILASSVGNVGLLAAGAGIGLGALVGGLGASVATAISFETAITKVAKTANFSKEETKAFGDEILSLSRRLPVATSSLTDIAVVAGQLGIQGTANIARFVEEIAKLQSTTGVGADALATGLGTLIQVSGLSIDAIDNISASLTHLGNTSNSTEQQILDFAVRLVGLGAALGVPLADILSISSSFAAAGVPVERGGTAIQNILIAIDKAAEEAGEELQLFADVAGLTAVEFQKLVDTDPGIAFAKFIEGMGGIKNAIPVLEALEIADARIVASALSAANAQAGILAPLQANRRAAIEGKATNEEFARSMDTTAAQLQLLKNNIQAAAITIGAVFNPAVRQVIESLNDFINAVRDGSVNAEVAVAGLVITVSALIAAFGPLAVVPLAIAAIAVQMALLTNDTDTASAAVLEFENAWFKAEIGILGVIHDVENGILTGILAPLNLAIDAINQIGNAGDFLGITVEDIKKVGTEDLGQTAAQKSIAEVQARIDANKQALKNLDITRDLQGAAEAERKFSVRSSGAGDREAPLPRGGGASGGGVAAAVDEMSKAIADGIIDIGEAAKLGLSDAQVVALELAEAAKTAQGESFRARIEFLKLGEVLGRSGLTGETFEFQLAVNELAAEEKAAADEASRAQREFLKLGIVLGRNGLTGEAFQLQLGLVAIQKHLIETGKSVNEFLFDISARALDGFRSAFDALFSRGTRESTELDLKRAKLEKERLGLVGGAAADNSLERELVDLNRRQLERSRVAGPHDPERLGLEAAIKDLEAEIAQQNDEARVNPGNDALAKIDEQIAAIDEEIAARRIDTDILRLKNDLADKSLLTDKSQLEQAKLLTVATAAQSAEMVKLQGAVFFETLAMLNAGTAANEFAAQMRQAAGKFNEQEQAFINAVARQRGEREPYPSSGGTSGSSANRATEEYYTGPGGGRVSKEEAQSHPNDPQYKKHVRQLAEGGIIKKHQFIEVGEGNKPELILPLTKPNRVSQLLDEAGLLGGSFEKGGALPGLMRSLTTMERPSIFSQIGDVARSLVTGVQNFTAPKAKDELRTLATQVAAVRLPSIADAQRQLTTAEQPLNLSGVPDAERSATTREMPFSASAIDDAVRELTTSVAPFAGDVERSLSTTEQPFTASAISDAERRLTTQEEPFEASAIPDAVRRLSTVVEPFAVPTADDAQRTIKTLAPSVGPLHPPGVDDAQRNVLTAAQPAPDIAAKVREIPPPRVFTLSEIGNAARTETSSEGGAAPPAAFASGGLIKKHSFIEVGEGNKPELILPLTKPERMSQLLDEAGLLRGRYEYGGVIGTPPAVTPPSRTTSTVVHVHGNIILPNVRKPEDFARELDRPFRRGV